MSIPTKKKIALTLFTLVLLAGLIFYERDGEIHHARTQERILKSVMPIIGLSQSIKIFFSHEPSLEMYNAEKDRRIKALELELQDKDKENNQLKEVFAFKNESQIPLHGTRILVHSSELGKEFLIIDRGYKDGVKEGDWAMDNDRFLIGAVSEVRDESSKVDFASNAGRAFEVSIASSTTKALAEGIGNRTFSVKLVPRDTPIHKGDAISTLFGRNRLFPLAEVVSIEVGGSAFLDIRAVLFAKPELDKNIFLITPPK